MRSGWKKVRLGDVLTFNYGKALTSTNRLSGEVPVYSSAGVTGFHNKPLIESAGIIVGRKGSVGTVYFSTVPFFCIDTAYFILPSDNYDLKYMYYRLRSLGLEKLNEDSAVPGLNRDTAYSQCFFLPPIHEQRAIASTLSCLDDKIELNKNINHHLPCLRYFIILVEIQIFSRQDAKNAKGAEIIIIYFINIILYYYYF